MTSSLSSLALGLLLAGGQNAMGRIGATTTQHETNGVHLCGVDGGKPNHGTRQFIPCRVGDIPNDHEKLTEEHRGRAGIQTAIEGNI
jgi:hypothetical protein